MERTNGAMSKTTTEVGGVIDSRHFGLSKFNYIFDNFATTPQTPNTETKKANPRMMWEMVDTEEEVIESLELLITKRKLKVYEPNTKRKSRRIS
jgi:hypothetical protein